MEGLTVEQQRAIAMARAAKAKAEAEAEVETPTTEVSAPRSLASTVAQYSPLRMLGMSEQTERELAAGGARGLGSVAATVGEGLRAAGVGTTIPTRTAMDEYLAQTMRVSPEAGAYKAGQLMSEVGVTLPIPGALGSIAARIPGVSALAPAIRSAGFDPGKLTGLSNIGARIGGGALAGGASAGLVNPEEALFGAQIGAALGPVGQVALGGARAISDRFIAPAAGAANALLRAGGEELANALRGTAGMATTPGFKPTLAERAVEGGVRSPTLAKLEKTLTGVEAEVQGVYNAQIDRVNALRQQLQGVENQLAQQAGALRPDAQATLSETRNQLLRSLSSEEATLQQTAARLEKSLRDAGELAPGQTLAERAGKLRAETRAQVVEPAYRRAFEAAEGARIDVSPVLAEAERILGKPLTAFAPETAPSIVRELSRFAPKAPEAAPAGAGKISSRIMTRPEAPTGPATASLEELDAVRKVINAEISAAARGTSTLSATEARNLSQLHKALDDSVASSTTLSDDAKSLYASALDTYRTKFAPRFKEGATARLLQPSAFNETRLLPENAVGRYLSSEADAQQFVATFGGDAAARSAMGEGIESLFRSRVVDPVTKQIKPDAAAKFLADNQRALNVLEQNGVSVGPRLRAVEVEARRLEQGMNNVAALRTEFGGDTAQDVMERLIKDPSRMKAALGRLDENGKAALAQSVSDRVTNMLQGGDAGKALKYLVDNEATVKQALGGKGVWTDMKDLAEQYIQFEKAAKTLAQSSSLAPFAATTTDVAKRLTPAEIESLKLVAADIKRADEVAALAGITQAPTPRAARIATEAREESGVKTPAYLENGVATARAIWASLEGRMNKKVAAELTNFMYRDPDAAIAALDAAQKTKASRQAFTGAFGRGLTTGGAQIGQTVSTLGQE